MTASAPRLYRPETRLVHAGQLRSEFGETSEALFFVHVFYFIVRLTLLWITYEKGAGSGRRKPAPALGHFASRSLQQPGKLVSHEAHLFVRHSLVQDIPR